MVKKELLEEYLTDSTEETENLRTKLSLFDEPDCALLVGFHCPDENAEDGVFIIYDELESIHIASQIIKKLEIWKRFQTKRALNKKPSRRILTATTKPSVNDSHKHPPRRQRISVEIQATDRSIQANTRLSFRTSADCRDGYLELRPLKSETFHSVHRRRIAQGIQSAAERVNCAQQTDPTFPTNAHTQYSYGEEKVVVVEGTTTPDAQMIVNDPSTQEDKVKTEENNEENLENNQKTSISISKPIKDLIKTLEFNQIDMYRVEYETLEKAAIPKFKIPYLEEIFCFAEISKTNGRYVSHIEWHPKYSGLFIATYTWNTLSTFIPFHLDPKIDPINRIILETNYIFMWTFEDLLNPLLSFESPREVATVSFHPLDANLLIGGLVNGQVIIWDLTDVVENLEELETPSVYREDLRKFLNWTEHSFKRDVVKRSAVSSLEFSQTDRITEIKWLNSNIFMSSGEIKESTTGHQNRFFATSSMDGTVAFWNLEDGSMPEEKDVPVIPVDKKKGKIKKNVSEIKTVKLSKYAHYDRKFRPLFVIVLQEPISSFCINSARFTFTKIGDNIKMPTDLSTRCSFKASEVPFAVENQFLEDEEDSVSLNHLQVTTLSGQVMIVKWKSPEPEAAAVSNRQDKISIKSFPAIHDGPIVAMNKNPIIPLLILTVGRGVFAIWRSDYPYGPIYSQRRAVELSDCKWSLTRPSVVFLTRIDGRVEIWDLLSDTQEPCLVETIGGGVLTTISQQILPMGVDCIAIGDYNSNVRIFKLPKTFSQFTKYDEEKFMRQIDKEVARKEKLRQRQLNWMRENEDFLEAKRRLDEETLRPPSPAKQLLQVAVGGGARKKQSKGKKDIVDSKELLAKSELKWEKMNMKRLMQTMMKIKDIDPKEVSWLR